MPWKRSFLVVANVTASSSQLAETLEQRARSGPAVFTLLVPATPFGGGRTEAAASLAHALERLRDAGLEADGVVGDADPIIAVTEAWDPKRYDEIIVSTLPLRLSKWLHAGLPDRIARLTGATVTHIVSEPPRPPAATVTVPQREKRGVMSSLSVLEWGARKER